MLSTNRDRILEALRLSSQPLDDDELARRAEVSPRQTVNQVCRALEVAGVLRRHDGPDGKIVNELVSRVAGVADPSTATGEASTTTTGTRPVPPGSSSEQRDAERVMLDLLAVQLGYAINPTTLTVPSGARVEVDGADAGRQVLVECWAHQGPPKVAQKHKVLTDAFKLAWIATTVYPRPRLILCLSDPEAAAPFLPTSRSWAAQALQDFGITVIVVDLPADVRQRIREAQKRQYR